MHRVLAMIEELLLLLGRAQPRRTRHSEPVGGGNKYSMKLAAGRSSDALDFFVVIPE